MSEGQTFYDRQAALTWWYVLVRIGKGLKDRYQLSKELPPKLLAVISKLDAIEGNYLPRYTPPLERRSVGESDWSPPRFVWQNDVDLFGG